MPGEARCTPLDAQALRAWPLPPLPDGADKEERGRVLVVAGSREIPGAAQLAAIAALRAGAGKLVIATGASVAAHLAQAVPEARVIALPETAEGAFRAEAVEQLAAVADSTSAALLGPGLMDGRGSLGFLSGLLPLLVQAHVVLDALAMEAVGACAPFAQPVALTPHAGEMAHLLGLTKGEIVAEPAAAARRAARQWNAVVALKGATTVIAQPDGTLWRHEAAHPGLATSGSGDVLAGLIVGFSARQPPLVQACCWGVVLHALAGAALARAGGPIGYLARELPAVVPGLLRGLSGEDAAEPEVRAPGPTQPTAG